MLKKGLIIGSLGLLGFGLYRYFKYQIDMAMKYDYKIKNFKYIGIEGNNIKVSATIEITNKSRFNLKITSFDLDLFYNGKKFADVISSKEIEILPNSSFEIKGEGIINVNDLKSTLPVFLSDVLKEKPIDIEVEGNVKVNFMNINSTIQFNKEKFNYSSNILSEYGLKDKTDKLKKKYPKLFSILW